MDYYKGGLHLRCFILLNMQQMANSTNPGQNTNNKNPSPAADSQWIG